MNGLGELVRDDFQSAHQRAGAGLHLHPLFLVDRRELLELFFLAAIPVVKREHILTVLLSLLSIYESNDSFFLHLLRSPL